VHHAAWFGVGVADFDVVSEPPQVVRARQAGRTGADYEHTLAGRRARGNRPPLFIGEIAEESIERMDGDGLIEELAVAGAPGDGGLLPRHHHGSARAPEVEAAGVHAVVTDTMMRSPEIAAALAAQTLAAVA